MPLYLCATKNHDLDEPVKRAISKRITAVHCALTGAPEAFVHVFFFESDKVTLLQSLWGGNDSQAEYQLFGNIRSGRDNELKHQLVNDLRQGLAEVLEVDADNVYMATKDVSARWVMEGGDLLPEPGEEAEWLAKHNAKT